MSHYSVVARMRVRPYMVGKVQQEMERLVESTRCLDEGCIAYDPFLDSEDPSLFWFVETWENEELLKRHLGSGHMNAFQQATEGLLEETRIHRLKKIA